MDWLGGTTALLSLGEILQLKKKGIKMRLPGRYSNTALHCPVNVTVTLSREKSSCVPPVPYGGSQSIQGTYLR
jgi:hypothetical protein